MLTSPFRVRIVAAGGGSNQEVDQGSRTGKLRRGQDDEQTAIQAGNGPGVA